MNIGIVNDAPLAVEALRRILALRPEHRVAWVAQNGAQAVDFCAAHPPDLVLMELVMPELDGAEATRRIMASQRPCPILVVTSAGESALRADEAMQAGALGVVHVPALGTDAAHETAQPLLAKVDQIGLLIQTPHFRARTHHMPARRERTPLVAIGASAGGPNALASILGGLPADFHGSIVIVQHVDKAFARGMAQWLDRHTALQVLTGYAGAEPRRGVALLAATNDHLHLTREGKLEYTREPVDTPYRPSVDVFFESIVKYWRADAIGVLLTGMGRDGAIGLKAMRSKGYHTIAQDEATSAVYGMPKAAADVGAARSILPLERIADELAMLVGR